MIYFYASALAISAALLVLDFVLLYLEKIKSLGFENRLFKRETETIPLHLMLPQTLTALLAGLTVFSAAGVIMTLYWADIWYMTLPLSLFAGSLFCLILQYVILVLIRDRNPLPRGDECAGLDGYIAERVTVESYGVVAFDWNGKERRGRCVTVYEQPIEEYEKVILLDEEDGLYFVEHISELYSEYNHPTE